MASPSPPAPLPVRILVCQTAALSCDVRDNLSRWAEILAPYSEKDEIDIVQFPETAFSRYFFRDAKDAAPSMELEGHGPVFNFLSQLAKRLRAYVVCGYMEKKKTAAAEEGQNERQASADQHHASADLGYNSLYLISREGALLRESYRKRHLFQPDYAWCRPGSQDQPLTLELWSKANPSRKFIAGLINCQEILGDMDDRDAAGGPAARRLRNERCCKGDGGTETTGYEAIDVVLFPTCWPLFLADLPEPPKDFAGVWERAMKRDFLLKEQAEESQVHEDLQMGLRRRPLVFSVACGAGSEKNMTTPEGWGGRTHLQEKFSLEFLGKRGCSGVKVYSLPEAGARSESDVHTEVPVTEAHAPQPGAQKFAGEAWALGQVCMSYELEEARIFSLQLECAP